MNKITKIIFISAFLLLLLLPPVYSASDIFSTDSGFSLMSVWDGIVKFFSGEYFVDPEHRVGALRFLIWVFLFAVLWAATQFIQILHGNVRTIVAIIISLISVLFMPDSVLLSIGEAFGTFFSTFLIAGVIIGTLAIAYLAIRPDPANPGSYRFLVAARIAILVILILVLINIRNAVAGLSPAIGGLI